ncbi:class I SAM-dependent methyltransferase [Paracoccus salsus]|uniref:class I SAM-dependent methyltransferase n=1 Tax=Paracoccus salsus TaxID=2911061 RepID=UPI001F3FE1DD|nr:class I SAM-dependent methyltransferase [Paracoccus salsus]MCF3972628.1 class I SAM-dependent methyltransferase [Paracoccus salsus]
MLFPTGSRRVSFDLPAGACDPSRLDVDAFYRYPKRHGQPRGGTYHLDRAHADVMADMRKDSLVIDLGCGGAQMREWVEGQGLRYLGTDVSKRRVHDWLQRHGGADILCDSHALPFRDGVADVLYSAAVWEHLAFPQLAAQEAARVLRPGGYHLGSASFLEPWHDSSYFHMTPFGIHMSLILAGLKPLYIWPETAWSGFVAIMQMGNKATKPLSFLGRIMNAWYLAPKAAQAALRNRRLPQPSDLILPRGIVSGAIAWIAQKPNEEPA